jgi:hypothetical protein
LPPLSSTAAGSQAGCVKNLFSNLFLLNLIMPFFIQDMQKLIFMPNDFDQDSCELNKQSENSEYKDKLAKLIGELEKWQANRTALNQVKLHNMNLEPTAYEK